MSEINVLGPQSVSGYLVQYSPIAKMGWLIKSRTAWKRDR